MRRRAVILAAGLAALGGAPAAAAVPGGIGRLTPVHVAPRVGGAHTRFRFSLKLPSAVVAGVSGGYATLSVAGPRRAGCMASASTILPAGAAGARVHVGLDPGGRGNHWCAGRFDGYVLETIRLTCSRPGALLVCPQIVIAPRVIARFSFRVR